ncbi:hypothetical protein [Mycoplana dimorpha]|uniref:Uncharacterized protein n=1 Tax=Mycoplana dimorpha TaxID=28320 RepID=A0A2T5BAY9_MYCDI|nr:hypothetical protein [Mycoplana dimorpha]PTM96151.1 hypothetical protein C7449_103165 [Mycoplana dimorpha]
MLVYGDAERIETGSSLVAGIEAARSVCMRLPAGLDRHAALVNVFLRVGQLAQGIADAEFESNGADEDTDTHRACARLLTELACTVLASWNSGFANVLTWPSDWPETLAALATDARLRIREPEGHAFYALYPEAYGEAAMRSGLAADTVVIGIRSIGTGLAAIVAAALGAAPPVTVRPVGHPFQRELRVGPRLAARLLAKPEACFAVVDEGPGLSGSSFASVADWLTGHGVSRSRIHFFPSHAGGCGERASRKTRDNWNRTAQHVVGFDDMLTSAADPRHHLGTWIARCTGPLVRPLRDIGGGRWRELRHAGADQQPPIDGLHERRKYLAQTRSGTWCARFAGIGEPGVRKLRTARVLAEAGFCPAVAGLCHGFLIERWIDGQPVDAGHLERTQLVERIGRYLGFRAANLRAPAIGADPDRLFAMALANTGEQLGQERASALKSLLGFAERLEGRLIPVDTDNRLHRWEWLLTADGRLIKTDALDHSTGHDLIGPQDIGWDIAGATVEFDLSADERSEITGIVSHQTGRTVCAELLDMLVPCYLAFQIGLWRRASENGDVADRGRAHAMVRSYAERLSRLLD